jgi:DNA-binding CsgD family transcriptional regulator
MRTVTWGQPLTVALFTLGLTAAGVWTDVVGYSVNLMPSEHGILEGQYNRDAFHLGRLSIGILFLIFARFVPRIQNSLAAVTAFLMSVATGVVIISYHQTLLDPNILSSIGVIISSAGYSFIVFIFYLYAAHRMQTQPIVWCIAISLVFETVFSILISLYLDPIPQMVLVMLAPLFVAICYFGMKKLDASRSISFEPQRKVTGFEKYALLTQVVIFTATLIFVRALSKIGTWGENRTNFTGMTEISLVELAVICATILLLTFFVFGLPSKRLSLPLRCVIGFAAILLGLQILALSDEIQFGSSFDSITSAVEIFSHLVRWMIIIECLRSIDMPAFRVTGISNTASASLTLVWTHIFSPMAFATSTFVMIVIYILLLFVVLLFVGSSVTREPPTPVPEAVSETSGYLGFAQRWGLSPRETELFILLMQGCKRLDICKECSLSEGTVKTHITNIYKKLNIHSKRELHQIYEQTVTLRHQADNDD